VVVTVAAADWSWLVGFAPENILLAQIDKNYVSSAVFATYILFVIKSGLKTKFAKTN
jgi:hypothetical protein